MTSSSTLTALRQTSKGQLKYHKDWGCTQDIRTLLEECTSPPQLSTSISDHVANVTRRTLGLSLDSGHQQIPDGKDTNGSPAKEKREKVSAIKPKRLELRTGNGNDNGAGPSIASPDNENRQRGSPDNAIRQSKESLVVSPVAGRIEVAIKQVEDELKSTAEHNLKLRKERMEQQTKLLLQKSRAQIWEYEQNQELKVMRAQESLEASHLAIDRQIQEKKNRMKEVHKKHAEMLSEKIVKAEAQKKRLEELEKRRLEEAKKTREKMAQIVASMKNVKTGVDDMHEKCKHKNYLAQSLAKYIENVGLCVTKAETVVAQLNNHNKLEDVLKWLTELASKQQNIADVIKKNIDEANAKGEAELQQQKATEQAAQKAAQEATEKAAQEAAKAAAAAKESASSAAAASAQVAEGEILCVMPDSLPEYERLLKKQKEVENSVLVLSSTPQLKKLKMDLQKAVNMPVNSLSNTSGAHLRDKLTQLGCLLLGQPVEVSGKRVSASDHPAGIPFCMDLLARKLVKQGEEQISSNHEYAFIYGTIAVGVWCAFPEFGDLLKAHFYLKCPYLVPYYLPKAEGQSTEEYFMSLGYLYKDGECEKQDKFLKRMGGIARLYAAIMVAVPPPNSQSEHPHNLENAWLWFASILNIEPRADITASVLFDFLEVTGNPLWRKYGKQFQKVIHAICTDYLGKVWKVTPKGAGGPVKRLELFLQKCLTGGSIPTAKGMLASDFWLS